MGTRTISSKLRLKDTPEAGQADKLIARDANGILVETPIEAGNVGGGGGSQNLQQTTDNGNTTTNDISLDGSKLVYSPLVHIRKDRDDLVSLARNYHKFEFEQAASGASISNEIIEVYQNGKSASINNESSKITFFVAGGQFGELSFAGLTGNRQWQLPDQSGTIALVSDIPTGGGAGGELEKITEGGNTGYALKDRVSANYGDIGENAKDLSISTTASTTRGATGKDSFASGLNVIASGSQSFAHGTGLSATGSFSVAFGAQGSATGNGAFKVNGNCTASGNASFACGFISAATNTGAFAGGNQSEANGVGSFSFGANTEVNADYSACLGGTNNTIVSGPDAAIIGGESISLTGNRSVALGGDSKTYTGDETVFVPTLHVDDVLFIKANTLPATPVNGMIARDSADNKLKFYDGTAWKEFAFV